MDLCGWVWAALRDRRWNDSGVSLSLPLWGVSESRELEFWDLGLVAVMQMTV